VYNNIKERKKNSIKVSSKFSLKFYQDYQEGLKHALSICSFLGIQPITTYTTHQWLFHGKSDWPVMSFYLCHIT